MQMFCLVGLSLWGFWLVSGLNFVVDAKTETRFVFCSLWECCSWMDVAQTENPAMSRSANRRARATLTHEPLVQTHCRIPENQSAFTPWLYWQHFWKFVFLVFPPKMFYSLPLLPSPFISAPDHFWQVIQQYQPLPSSPQCCAFNLLQHSHKHPAQTSWAF